ncbi:MAG: efflux RND transporter permease subunit, partial [Bacteroidia bacterium]
MKLSYKAWSRIIILMIVLFTVVCGYFVQRLKFDYDFEAFFPNEDSELNIYDNYRKTFEYDNEFVLLALENKKGIFKEDFLKKVHALTLDLVKIPEVRNVVSPTNLKTLDLGGLAPVETPLLHYNDPSLYKDDSVVIYTSENLIGSFFPANARSVCIYIKTTDRLSKVKSDTLARRIERTYAKFNFDNVRFVGRIVAQDVYLKQLSHEFSIFLLLSFVVVVIFLYFSFRSVYGIIVPLSIVILAIFWTLGIMGMVGKPIDIMTVMLPTMIFIAGMSDVVHYFSKYFEELNKGTDKISIYKLILKEVGFPTFLTLITTVVGFLSLLFSSIKPIRDFGIYTSVGITIAFILSYTLLPALLFLFTPKGMVKIHDEGNKTYSRMRKSLFWIFRHQKTIVVITVIALLLSGWGISKIRTNNILLEDLSDKVKIKQDFTFFDENYSGVRPFELEINVKDTSKRIWDYEVMRELNKTDGYLKKEYGMGFMFSPSILAKAVNKAVNSGDAAAYKFPETKEEYDTEIKEYIFKNRKSRDFKRIITSNGKSGRLTGKIRDMGSLRVKELNSGFQNFIRANVDTNLVSFHITGAAMLLDKN